MATATLISYFDSYEDAIAAARKKNSDPSGAMIARVKKSPYGGYKVVVLPSSLVIGRLAAGGKVISSSWPSPDQTRRRAI
jgi:hypothetical protein